MANPEIKLRVERLLNGDFRPDDMNNILLFARDHCDGRQVIKDIGSFAAHKHERDKGIVVESARKWAIVMSFYGYQFANRGSIRSTSLPPATPDYLRIAPDRIGAADIRKRTGLKIKQAKKLVDSFVGRLSENTNGTWSAPQNTPDDEKEIFRCLSSIIVPEPAFKCERLSKEFIDTLKSNGLISNDQIREFGMKVKSIIEKYAVTLMHKSVINVGGYHFHELKASKSLNEISVLCIVDLSNNFRSPPHASRIFQTKLDPKDHCSEELLKLDIWDFPIELNAEGKIVRLQ